MSGYKETSEGVINEKVKGRRTERDNETKDKKCKERKE
jgi:hypothetical protein